MNKPAALILLALRLSLSALAGCVGLEAGTTRAAEPPIRRQEGTMRLLIGGSPCDLNRDGKVDVLDLNLGIQSILGNGALLDLDCDGLATVADLQKLVNAVLGGNCPTACALPVPVIPAVNNGHADLRIFFTPNPVVDNGAGGFQFGVSLVETNGVGVTLTSLTLGSDSTNRIDQLTTSRSIEAGGNLVKSFAYTLPAPLTKMQELPWEIRGVDQQGHENLVWQSSIRLVPFTSTRYGNLAIFLEPHPVTPDDDGTGSNLLVARETNDVGVTLTGLTINGVDYSAQILDPHIAPRSSIGAVITFLPDALPGYYQYVFRGNDDNGHTGLSWSAVNRLLGYLQLLSGIPREHLALRNGYLPYQFRVYAPEGSTSLTLKLEGPPAPENLLNLYVRAGSPVGGLENPFPPNPQADFLLTALGNGSLRIDASSLPPLQTGISYYLGLHRTAGNRALPFTITAAADKTPTTTTSTTSSTSTTRATTTTTSSSTSSTRATTTTTTTTLPPTTTTTSTTTLRPTTTTTSGSTTTTAPGSRPPFNPVLGLDFSTLGAGSTPELSLIFAQGPGELNVRSSELLIDAGRLDLGNLQPNTVLGSTDVQIPNSSLPPIKVTHTVVANDGTRVTTRFQASVLGKPVKLADGLFENTGSDGVRARITIVEINEIWIRAFQDGSVTDSQGISLPFAVGNVFILPAKAGTKFTASCIFTSVKFPNAQGTASTLQRTLPPFVTTP